MRTSFGRLLVGFLLSLLMMSAAMAGEKVLFVSDRDEPNNWDIYEMDIDTRVVRRLTTDPGIDNHPDLSHDGTKIVFSSTRMTGLSVNNPEGDFEIFVADYNPTGTIDATVRQLTNNNVTDTQIPEGQRHISDRHPHFSPDGTQIIYTAKYVCVGVLIMRTYTECSIPKRSIGPDANPCGKLCEGIRIMDATDSDGDFVGTI